MKKGTVRFRIRDEHMQRPEMSKYLVSLGTESISIWLEREKHLPRKLTKPLPCAILFKGPRELLVMG